MNIEAMNIDAHWFLLRPEKGGTWSVRLRWTVWAGDIAVQRQVTVATPHQVIWAAVKHQDVILAMISIELGEDPAAHLESVACPPGWTDGPYD